MSNKFLTQTIHPDVILYDFFTDIIILIEEESKLDKSVLYKKEAIQSIIKAFEPLFLGTENIVFQYLARTISSGIEKLDKIPNIIPQKDFLDILSNIFSEELLKVDIFGKDEIKDNLRKCIDIIIGKINLMF